jgi:hypothetical protein
MIESYVIYHPSEITSQSPVPLFINGFCPTETEDISTLIPLNTYPSVSRKGIASHASLKFVMFTMSPVKRFVY